MASQEIVDRLRTLLRARGPLDSKSIQSALRIGASTLSRVSRGGEVKRFGATNRSFYGLLRSIGDLGHEMPVFRVSEKGTLSLLHRLTALESDYWCLDDVAHHGLPPALGDMAPQGFSGRAFARAHAGELGVPVLLESWTDEHVATALARRGEDAPGNLILGKESAERWRRMKPDEVDRSQYGKLAAQALIGQPGKSSAGGERPKFFAFVEGRHVIVKFEGGAESPEKKRWRDLVICEEIALDVLRDRGLPAASSRALLDGPWAFLESERFDRLGSRGRRGVISLAAVANHLGIVHKSWSYAADRLEREGCIDGSTRDQVFLLEAFCSWIGDTDRHFHNLSFYSNDWNGRGALELAPIYDKLPMLFAPVADQLVPRPWEEPIPESYWLHVWDDAKNMAQDFWRRVGADDRVSREFRDVASGLVRGFEGD